MNAEQRKRISKRLSFVLRHQPDSIGIELDEAGWVEVEVLLSALSRHGKKVSREQLDEVVALNDKQRFELSEEPTRIRARQGHSVNVDLGYEPAAPPEVLFHGTATRFLESIFEQGLTKGGRHHVHLSADRQTASAVGTRHGKLAILEVDAATMARDGHRFFVTGNGVWLIEHVPVQYLKGE